MISYSLLIISGFLVIGINLLFVVTYLSNKKKFLEGVTGFDAAKEVTSNYDAINIISSNDVMFSEYDIKRNVIRLNKSNYEGNSYFDVIISVLLAGYSLVNSNNSEYFKFDMVVKKMRVYSIVPILMLVLSCFISNIGDAKIGIVIFGILLVYQYLRYMIVSSALENIVSSLNEKVYSKIKNGLGIDILFCKSAFIISLVMIVRLVVIILEI